MKVKGLSPVGARLLAAAALAVAFLIMASIFAPHQIEAQDPRWRQPVERGGHASSTNPHEGLPLLGTLEHACCLVRIYATDYGPRYSVYETSGGLVHELAVLLTIEQMEEHFPDLPVKDVEFGAGRRLMLAPVRGGRGGWDD